MKKFVLRKLLPFVLVFSLAMILLPVAGIRAITLPTVSISAPANVQVGGSFTARVNILNAPPFEAYQIQVGYNKNIIQVAGAERSPDGVSQGLVDGVPVGVDWWVFNPPGVPGSSIRILGRATGGESVSGSGYLAEIHFNVVGQTGQQSSISPTESPDFNNGIFDINTNKIDTTLPWGSTVVQLYLALQVSTSALPDGSIENSYFYNAAGAGGVQPYTWNADNLPAGLTISSGGNISGSPAASGDFGVVLHVNDNAASSANTTLNLHIYSKLTITTSVLPDATKGVNYLYNNLSVAGGKPGYTWSSVNLPAGLSISNAGIISGNASVAGDFNVAISVSDSFSPMHTTTKSFLLHISPGFQVDAPSLPDGVLGSFYWVNITASGGKSPYVFSATGLPASLGINPATGVISGSPQASGDSNVTITVTDASSPVNNISKNLTLHISAPLAITTGVLPRSAVEAGSWLPAYPGWVIGVPYTANGGPVALAAAGGKGNYHWTAAGLPAGLSISDSGVVSGTPAVGSFGLCDITFTVIDSASPAQSVSQHLFLKIYKPGDASGDDSVDIGDVTFAERVILNLNAPTAGCDANLTGGITIGDITKIERIILGLP